MAYSDDEAEHVLHSVSNYNFVDENDDPISFSVLPVQWSDGQRTSGKKKQIFMHGSIDNGLQKIYKQVEAWKFELSDAKLEILVLLSKENNWMKLQKPRKSHEDIFRTILITLQSLHFLRKNPETSGRALFDHLCKVLRFEPRPAENDLVDHANFICEVVQRDGTLAKSKIASVFLDKDPRKWIVFDKDVERTSTKSTFIVHDQIIDEADEAESDDEEQGDKVCSICDNGGDILCCEGKCLRSFHATVEAGADSACESLGFSDEQVEAIQNFYCKNCQYKRHQCFACCELGSSDDKSSAIEVFRCVSGECGRFYHPQCVSKLLHPANDSEAKELEQKISNGSSFTCPFHKCCVCKQTETEGDPDLRFAMCRRCPKSYHKKCLPSEIVFDNGSDDDGSDDEDTIPRAWENLMPKKRILVYCLDHEIDEELATPLRNHIKFPGEAKKKQPLELQSSKGKIELKKRNLVLEEASRKKTSLKPTIGRDKVFSATKQVDSSRKGDQKFTRLDSVKKQKVMDRLQKPLSKPPSKLKSMQDKKEPTMGGLGTRIFALCFEDPETIKSKSNAAANGQHDPTHTVKSIATKTSTLPPLDTESEKRILSLMKDATSSITLAEINEKHKVPTTHAYSSKHAVDRTITLGKVEGSVEAVREAVKKLEEGCSIEDARAVCGPGLLNEMMKWKNKLKVYLAPFLHGMRYTSFGRHFTKMDKLEKVVDMLHWYAQDGDTIVDFCCGANDFSCLMKKRLDEVGKKCSYKNYDVIQPKNDFNFEKRDWMSVNPNELPPGSQLIMGLNPPFGVRAALANKFVDKALKFKPKLIVLIVPPETERLDTKDPPYDLVFEDNELLAGRSFYLPGSVDINDKQMDQWNNNPPPLYFWSRRDWTVKHNAIAQQHSHLHRRQEVSRMVDNCKDIYVHNFPSQDCKFSTETSMQSDVHSPTAEKAEVKESVNNVKKCYNIGFPCDLGGSGPENHHSCNTQLNENSNKRRRSEEKQRIGSAELSQEDERKRRALGASPEDKQKKGGSGDEQKKRVPGEALPEDKKKRGGSGETSLDEKKRVSGDVLPEDKKKRGSGEMSLEQRKRVSGDVLPEDKKKRGSGEMSLEVKKKKSGSSEISHDEKPKKQGSGRILVEDKKKRRGSLEISPEDRKKRRGSNEISPDTLPEVRQKRRGSHEVSPVERQNTSFLPRQRQPVGSHSLAGVQTEGYHHFDSRVSRSQQITPEILSDVRQKRRGSREISPMEKQYTSTLPRQFQPVESPSLAGVRTESYQPFDSRTSGSHQFGAGYNGIREDNMAHVYGDVNVDPYQSSIYRERVSELQLPGYRRESTDYRGYMSCVDNPSSQRSNYLASHDPRIPTPYENFGSVPNLSSNRPLPDSSYNRTSTSAMQRYAPRLDELNQPRVNNLGPDPPFPSIGNYDLHAPRPPYQGNLMRLSPGPYFRQ